LSEGADLVKAWFNPMAETWMATWVTGPLTREAFALGETPEAAVHNLTGCAVNKDEDE
jgi:hypothetical protein